MNVLDENIIEEQRLLLHQWHIPVRHVGYDLWRAGVKDDEIITLLLRLPQPTFFTLDSDYYRRRWRHARYCLVYLTVDEERAADYIRRVLRHQQFNTIAKRMGSILRVSPEQITVWRLHATEELIVAW